MSKGSRRKHSTGCWRKLKVSILLQMPFPAKDQAAIDAARESLQRYVLTGGQRLPASRSFKDYFGDLRDDLSRGKDFSLQNLQCLDSKFLIAVCAIAALLINGGIAYASYRKNRTKPS